MYYIVFILGLALSLINDKKLITFRVFAFILLFLALFRYGVGADYFSYKSIYYSLNPDIFGELTSALNEIEIGFRLLGSLSRAAGLSYQIFIMIIAAINIFFIYKTCKEHSANPTLSLMLYFCFYYFVWTFSGLRQGLTIVIGIYFLLKYIQQNKSVRFIMIVALLALIHYSAFVLLLLYYAGRIEFKKKTLLIILGGSILLSLIPLGGILSHLSWLPDRFLRHFDTGSWVDRLIDIKTLGRVCFLAVAFFYYDRYTKQDGLSKKMMNIYVLSFVIYFGFQFSELVAARLAIYGKILDVVILANIYELYKEKIKKTLYYVFLLGLLLLLFNKELLAIKEYSRIDSPGILVPYTNIFCKDRYGFTFPSYVLRRWGVTSLQEWD